jgi:Flp pilus assembly CpaE family ATPase
MGYVQSDYKTAVNSINLGKPLVESEPNSKIAAELRQITASVTGTPVAAPASESRGGLLGSLFRRRAESARVLMPPAAGKEKEPVTA